MMVSTKGRYALRVMVELAVRESEGFVSLRGIAENQQISEKYLEIIMKSLVKAGLVVGLRGKGGGYRMAQPPQQCTVAEILRATEGSLAPVACLEEGAEECERCDTCETLGVWKDLYTAVNQVIDGVTLADLLERRQKRLQNLDYSI